MVDSRVYQIKNTLADIQEATDGSRSGDRYRLATVYEIALAVPSFYPRPPLSMKRYVAQTLRKKTCSHCPSKIKPKAMIEHVAKAKGQLREYSARLREWLTERGADQPSAESTKLHDLDSTI